MNERKREGRSCKAESDGCVDCIFLSLLLKMKEKKNDQKAELNTHKHGQEDIPVNPQIRKVGANHWQPQDLCDITSVWEMVEDMQLGF